MREAEAAANEAQIQARKDRHADSRAGTSYALPLHGPRSAPTDTVRLQPTASAPALIRSMVPYPPPLLQRQEQAQLRVPAGGPRPGVWAGCDPGFISYYLDFFLSFPLPFLPTSHARGRPHLAAGVHSEAEGMRQTTLALSSYLFSIVLDATEAGHEICERIGWDKLLAEMKGAFTKLRDDIPRLSQAHNDPPSQLSRAVRVLGNDRPPRAL